MLTESILAVSEAEFHVNPFVGFCAEHIRPHYGKLLKVHDIELIDSFASPQLPANALSNTLFEDCRLVSASPWFDERGKIKPSTWK
jgi:hypothetical protein